MRHLLIVLLTGITFNCFCQAPNYVAAQKQETGPAWLYHTPGTELKRAANCFFTSVLLEGGGFVLLATSAAASTRANPNAGAGGAAIGVLMILAGPVFDFLAWVHIKHAGTLMDMGSKRISFGGTRNGIGLTYTL